MPTAPDPTTPPIHAALAAVMRDVQAVRKGDRNETQGFSFRGIDAVMNAVGPALRDHGIVVLPFVVQVDRSTVEVGRSRTVMGHVSVLVDYTFVGPAGDSLTARATGEAMDSGDKAGAKAMSVAFRTCLLQALCLPTDEPDPDHGVYERAPAEPEGISPEAYAALIALIDAAETADDLAHVGQSVSELPVTDEQRRDLRRAYVDRKHELDQAGDPDRTRDLAGEPVEVPS